MESDQTRDNAEARRRRLTACGTGTADTTGASIRPAQALERRLIILVTSTGGSSWTVCICFPARSGLRRCPEAEAILARLLDYRDDDFDIRHARSRAARSSSRSTAVATWT